MTDKTFVDTNILVYAHDSQAGAKHAIAAEEVRKLWIGRSGVLSLQVLQELYVTLTQKIAKPLPWGTVKDIVEQYGYWETVPLKVDDLSPAMEIQHHYRFSFWDSLIVQAARQAGCAVLLSEDLSHGQKVHELTIRNPFEDK